jgi:hypothetical protein
MAASKQHQDRVTGMCKHISAAISRLRFDRNDLVTRYDTELCRKNFPEYFSYKPKTEWIDDGMTTGYWWSTKTPRGRERRLRVLEAIAAGKDKSITGNLP